MKYVVTPKPILTLLLALLLAMPGLAQGFGGGNNVTAELIADVDAVAPGQTFTLGLTLEMEPGWHVYWINPEGPGFPVSVGDWDAPEGFEISAIKWPAPHKFEFDGEVQFGYGDQVTLLFEVTAPDNLEPGQTIQLGTEASWLACETMCIPGDADVAISLPVAAEPGSASGDAQAIAASKAELPRALDGWEINAQPTDTGYTLLLTAPDGVELSPDVAEGLYFFSSEQYAVDPTAEQAAIVQGNTITLALTARTTDGFGAPIDRDQPAERLVGALSAGNTGLVGADGQPVKAIRIDAALTTAGATSNAQQSAAPAGEEESSNVAYGFWVSLGAAFIGGLILNLMPCVFPVLSIKILGFVNQSGEQPALVRRHGYAFGIGVLISFWALAGLLLGLRYAAAQAGGVETFSWGFQMQRPLFVLGIVLLMFLVGLNLAGVFEIGVGMTSIAGKAGAGATGYTKSFLSGVLATLVATPCTAPFMAPALGAALGLPTYQAMLIFTSLGVGMATPYVVLSCFPALLGYLPKPGAWMESFKQAMAFPMFATAGYFLLVYVDLIDTTMVAWGLVGMSIIAMGAWVYGRWSTPMRTANVRWIGRGIAAVMVLAGLATILMPAAGIEADRQAATDAREAGEYVVEWLEFSPEKVDQLQADGRPVLVDFTATWCITCQANKRTALRTDSSKDLYRELNVALVEADYTRQDPVIGKALEQYGRSGVPTYLMFPADGGEPEILPNLLTNDILADAIRRATSQSDSTQQAAN